MKTASRIPRASTRHSARWSALRSAAIRPSTPRLRSRSRDPDSAASPTRPTGGSDLASGSNLSCWVIPAVSLSDRAEHVGGGAQHEAYDEDEPVGPGGAVVVPIGPPNQGSPEPTHAGSPVVTARRKATGRSASGRRSRSAGQSSRSDGRAYSSSFGG